MLRDGRWFEESNNGPDELETELLEHIAEIEDNAGECRARECALNVALNIMVASFGGPITADMLRDIADDMDFWPRDGTRK